MQRTVFCSLSAVLVLLIMPLIGAQSQPANNLAGVYERTEPDYAKLEIKATGANKIHFHLTSRYQRSEKEGDVNTAEAQGIAVVRINVAEYDDGSGQVHLRFDGDRVQVRASESYCGLNTTLDGDYRKRKESSTRPNSTGHRTISAAQSALAKADLELNKVYKQVLTLYRGQPQFLQKLESAEVAWIRFRDAHVESRFPKSEGSQNADCRAMLLTQLTSDRIRQLQEWIDGVSRTDMCAGTIQRR